MSSFAVEHITILNNIIILKKFIIFAAPYEV